MKLWNVVSVIVPLFVISGLAAAEDHNDDDNHLDPDVEVGKWEVGDCIKVQFSMDIILRPNTTNSSHTVLIKVPQNASVDSAQKNCKDDQQRLQLKWKDRAVNDTSVFLNRNLSIIFEQRSNQSYYGVSRFYAKLDLAYFTEGKGKNVTQYKSWVEVDTGNRENLMFVTPLNRSFLCVDLGDLEVRTVLNFNVTGSLNTNISDTTISAHKVQFDAYRTKDTKPDGFRTPVDCNYKPNDIVPIAVGIALAGIVISFVIAYVIGRRRNRQRGYQSV